MIDVVENCWIPLDDGTRLAAKLWLPTTARDRPVPAILEYLPYRKNDGTAQGDPVRHAFFAAHGYAGVRVDLRGSGDSDGLLFDEYHAQEALDGVAVIAWLARQPWCNGRVGMIGISWGGFNALQIAACRPAALGAIITVASTDDRYADDVHYLGGAILAREALTWAATFTSIVARPPDPRWQGAAWRSRWLERIDALPHYAALWLQHQTRDDYWRQGSVCEDFGAITCPVYAVGGWADAYTNAVPRLLAGLNAPRKGLIGPWAHNWPNVARPQPAIGFLSECVRWWDHWLKGIDSGIMAEPMLRVWLQEAVAPASSHRARPGRWVAEAAWPAPADRIVLHTLALAGQGLVTVAARPAPGDWQRVVATGFGHGQDSGNWCPFGARGDLAPDQRAEDGRATTFDASPARTPVDLLGQTELQLELAVDQPDGAIVARLCDIAPDGTSLLIARAALNLTHRHGHVQPEALTPGATYTVTLRFDFAGHTLAAGHHWRLALATSYWPMLWPAATMATLHISAGELRLPIRLPNPRDARLAPFAPPDGAAPQPATQLATASARRIQSYQVATGEHRLEVGTDQGRIKFEHGLETAVTSRDAFSIRDHEPLSARVEASRSFAFQRDAWQVAVTIDASITCDADALLVEQSLRATEGGRQIRARHWLARIPRQP